MPFGARLQWCVTQIALKCNSRTFRFGYSVSYYIYENIYAKVFKELHKLISFPGKKKNLALFLTRKISVQNVGNTTLDSL